MREFSDPEQKKEYDLEMARVYARLDVELCDKRIEDKARKNRHLQFLYTVFVALISATIGFWISYFTK